VKKNPKLTRRTSPSLLEHIRYNMSLVGVVNSRDVEPEGTEEREKRKESKSIRSLHSKRPKILLT